MKLDQKFLNLTKKEEPSLDIFCAFETHSKVWSVRHIKNLGEATNFWNDSKTLQIDMLNHGKK